MGIRNDSGIRKDRRRGRWVIDFIWNDKGGQEHRYRKDARVQSREGALLEARELRQRALCHGTLEPPALVPTFKEFVEGAFASKVMPRFKKSTRVRYEALLRQGIAEYFGPLRLDQVGDALKGYAAELAGRNVQGKGPCSFVKTILRAAVELKVLAVMPIITRVWKEPKKLPGAPSPDIVEQLLNGTRTWLRVAMALAAYAGLRSCEVRALKVRHIDFEGGRVLILESFSEDEVGDPKSWQRAIPIAASLLPILEEAVRGKKPGDFVVTNGAGKTAQRQAILGRLNALEDRLGIEHWTFHQLRHCFCTTLLVRGATIEEVRQLAGHQGLGPTARYVHATAAALKDAVNRLGSMTVQST